MTNDHGKNDDDLDDLKEEWVMMMLNDDLNDDLEGGVGEMMMILIILKGAVGDAVDDDDDDLNDDLEGGVGAAHVSLRRWSASLYLRIYLNDCDHGDNDDVI